MLVFVPRSNVNCEKKGDLVAGGRTVYCRGRDKGFDDGGLDDSVDQTLEGFRSWRELYQSDPRGETDQTAGPGATGGGRS